ncbi:MAG: hypothetical protein JWN38_599 [Candidatus Saccharibacteria bacterium]|nr:hypothetical protein [Candidatus Saccharibacteria bacterium]
MTEPEQPKKTAEILAAQGEGLDALQNMRLNFASDPVYAHLATLATAGALAGITWEISDRKFGRSGLVAVQHREGKRDTRRPGAVKRQTGNLVLDGGVVIRGQLDFAQDLIGKNRVLPLSIDRTVVSKSADFLDRKRVGQLCSSTITLNREASGIYGVPALQIGVKAVHASASYLRDGTAVGIINETADKKAFGPLLKLLERTSDLEFPVIDDGESSTRDLITRIQHRIDTTVTSDPNAHFAFHESLGVPEAIVQTGRTNFGVLVAHMDLPYQLPTPE